MKESKVWFISHLCRKQSRPSKFQLIDSDTNSEAQARKAMSSNWRWQEDGIEINLNGERATQPMHTVKEAREKKHEKLHELRSDE